MTSKIALVVCVLGFGALHLVSCGDPPPACVPPCAANEACVDEEKVIGGVKAVVTSCKPKTAPVAG